MSATPPDDDRTVLRPGSVTPPADDRTVIRSGPPAGAVPSAAAGDDHGNGLPIGTYLGEFELISLIGEGGFGIVYAATDHSLQRRVALKEYMPSALAARAGGSQVQVKSARHRDTFEAGLKSFVNEARLLAQFDHPSLVKVYRFWEANGTAYMVMPFIEGTTLKDVLRAMGQPPDEAWLRALLAPLTEALRVIHAEQCYHRDIAPDNVMMLAGSNRPLLLDFGAARRVIGDMTQALTVILKPGYAPVEQYAEIPGMKQGPWTDVYALAAVVYFAIMGKTPPPSVGRLLNDTYVPLVQAAKGRYSERFLAAIDRALVVKPEERTQSIDELRADLGLGEVAFDPGITRPLPLDPPGSARAPAAAPARAAARAAAPTPSAAPAPAGGNSMLLIGGGVAALVVVAFGAYLMLAPPPRPAPAPAPVAAVPAPAPAVAPTPAPPAMEPAPAPAAAAPAGFDVATAFDRVVRGQSAGFEVQAQASRTTLRIGQDDLAFSVQSAREGYLYVFAYGADGALVQLLPNAVSGTVRVKPGQRFRFPTGDGVVLEMSDPPGPGQLLVVVSARQRDHSALEPKKEGPFRLYPTGADASALAARNGGGLPPLVGRAICPANGACDESYGAASFAVEVVR